MALTKQQLAVLNNTSFPDNNTGYITPDLLRTFNSQSVASAVNVNDYVIDSASFSASIAELQNFSSSLDATFATDAQLNYSSSVLQSNINTKLDTSSYQTDSASFNSRINAAAVNTSSFVTTSSFNSFTQSYYVDSASFDSRVTVNASTASANSSSIGLLQTFSGSQYKTDSASFSSRIIAATNEGQFVLTSSFNSFTSSYYTDSASFNSRINSTSSSVGLLQSFSGSQAFLNGTYATTGSNQFNGDQNITGSLTASTDIRVNSMTVGKGGGSIATNIAFGSASLRDNTTATNNIGLGQNTLRANTIGTNNIAVGANVLQALTSATLAQVTQNVIIGGGTAATITIGARNTIIGASAFTTANNTERNTGIGRGVLSTIGALLGSGSAYNSAMGHNAGFNLTTGSNNVIIHGGSAAGEGWASGSNNIILGMDASLPTTMESNTIIGRGIAGLTSPLSNNVILADGKGNIALQKNGTTGVLRVPNGLETTGSLTLQSGSATFSSSFYIQSSSVNLPQSTGSAVLTYNPSTGQIGQASYVNLLSASFDVGGFQTNVTNSGSAGVSQSVNFEVTDVSKGVSVQNNSQITVSNAGTYLLVFSAQLDCSSGADTIWIWLKKNGTNVAESNTKARMANNTSQTMTVNFMLELAANDYFELVWQNNAGHGQLLAENASGNYPAIPAIILTVNQVH